MVKTAVHITRALVGILFIFSGLVKANDPLGLSYKMQEFFELWHMTGLNHLTLAMSVLMNAFEIIAGFALLIGWKPRFFTWVLLGLIFFFTFLTGYAYFSGKFRNCGCFGDCLPISPLASFIKDIALLLMIAFLVWQQRFIRSLFSSRTGLLLVVTVALLSFGLQWYTLKKLPIVDCLPFKEGNNIPEKMKVPTGARPDSFAIRFVYEKGGRQYEFDASELPADLDTYRFVDRVDKLVRKGNAEPAIRGFNLVGLSKADSTQEILDLPYALLLFVEDFSVPVSSWQKEFSEVYKAAGQKNIGTWVVTTQPGRAVEELSKTPFGSLPVMACDFTSVRTAARTNPCLYLLRQGTVLGKWSRADFDEAVERISELR